MGRGNFPLQAFNRGEIGALALGRVDVDRLRLSAEEMLNWVPRTVGPMTLRTGLAYVGRSRGNLRSHAIPFVFSMADRALLEATAGALRVLIEDQAVARPGTFSSFPAGLMADPAAWAVSTVGYASVEFAAGSMTIRPRALGTRCVASAPITVASPGVEHALRISVLDAPVLFRIGTSLGKDDVFTETQLGIGTHSLAFVPAGNVVVQFQNADLSISTIHGAVLELPGDMVLPAPWGELDLPNLRHEQSGDVVFLACLGLRPRRIERRGPRSWSLIEYRADDGPFQAFPAKDMQLTVFGGGAGTTTLLSQFPLFKPGHVGSLVRLFTSGFNHAYPVAGALTYTPAIRISGVGATRLINFSVGGTFSAHWVFQRSLTGPENGFQTVGEGDLAGTFTHNDGFDNSIAWYRLGLATYNSGVANLKLDWSGGGRQGVGRIRTFTSATEVQVDWYVPTSSGNPTTDWRMGDWSDLLGYPSSCAIYDGRLIFAGRDRFWASVSDAYNSFADTIDGSAVGDSSAITRSVGYGPVAVMNWVLGLSRLLIGAEGSEISVRSSSLDAPLTPSGGVTIKDCSTQGSARVAAVKCDKRGLFVQKSGQRLFQLAFDVNSQDYEAADMNRLHPDLFLLNPCVRLAVQRSPDTRIHCLRADGTVAVLTFQPDDEVEAWWRIETDGFVEDLCVLPDAIEDRVYYTVRRTIAGVDVRYRERFARLDQCRGEAVNRQADAHVVYEGAATATIIGLDHLEGCSVVAWGDGRDLGTFTVAGGAIALEAPVAAACVGLPYEARFKSAKLAYAASAGTALNQIKRVVKVGLILGLHHALGVQFGQTFDVMDDLPLVEGSGDIDPDAIRSAYDERMLEFPGDWDTDARLCLTARAPRPCTVMAAVVQVETHG